MTHRTWPIWVLAAPAAVAIWGGWVELGRMCGYGPVQPLPGIANDFTIDLAITLPIGVEALAAYSLAQALNPGLATPVRTFARWTAGTALFLGAAGQIAYHVLAAAGATTAPTPLIAVVAVLPVVTLALAAALAHLIEIHTTTDTTAIPTDEKEPVPDENPLDAPRKQPPPGLQTSKQCPIQGDQSTDCGPGHLHDPAPPGRSRPVVPAASRTVDHLITTPAQDNTVDVIALAKQHPDWTNAQLAKAAGVSVSTVKRRRRAATTATQEVAA